MPPPEITRELVVGCIKEFDHRNNLTERVITRLIKEFPKNSILEEVLLKVCTINTLYNAYVFNKDLESVAHRIRDLDIDEQLEGRNSDIPGRIATAPKGERRYYSFATKYCSWHQPSLYPIYDSLVGEVLWEYRKKFGECRPSSLRDYGEFREIVKEFKRRYHLQEFSFKEIDKFLWIFGKRRRASRKYGKE